MRELSQCTFKNIQNKVIAVLGYGAQGEAQALNLKDSGLNVIVGLKEDSMSISRAQEAGFEVLSPSAAAAKADIILMLIPDETHPDVFTNDIRPNLRKGGTVITAHGFSFHFGFMKDFQDFNIGMVAPKAVGKAVRKNFIEEKGILSLIAKFHIAEGDLDEILCEIAKGIGSIKALETTFKNECETDIFGEQAVLCGGVISLMEKAFEVLTEGGYEPEIAYYECVHELKLIADIIYEKGVARMFDSISNTAKYGGFTRGHLLVDENVKVKMRNILKDVQNGSFAREFMDASLKKNYAFKKDIKSAYENSQFANAGKAVINILK